jgi:hypothetical protein
MAQPTMQSSSVMALVLLDNEVKFEFIRMPSYVIELGFYHGIEEILMFQ